MAKFNMVVPHGLTQGEALRRIVGDIEVLKKQYGNMVSGLRESWNDNTYEFEGMAIAFRVPGAVAVRPSMVKVQAELPWQAMLFKGRIESEIRKRLSLNYS